MFTYLIPCRNNAELLEDTLNSIHFDNEFVDEVIVIDDYSDQFISSSISFKHDKLNIYRNKSKPGLTSALNYGIDKVKSIYVLRMDSDDLDLPTRISTTIQALKDYPNADILSFAKRLDKDIMETVLWPKLHDRIVRYKPFLKYDIPRYKMTLRKKVKELV